jgi:threonine/homoserine/homoserine lactone efflux protein
MNQPKVITWWIAVILAVVGVLASLGVIPALASFGVWFVVVGFVLLALATTVKGL